VIEELSLPVSAQGPTPTTLPAVPTAIPQQPGLRASTPRTTLTRATDSTPRNTRVRRRRRPYSGVTRATPIDLIPTGWDRLREQSGTAGLGAGPTPTNASCHASDELAATLDSPLSAVLLRGDQGGSEIRHLLSVRAVPRV